MKTTWEEEHTAFIGIRTYIVCREARSWVCYVERREFLDCYSSTRTDNRYQIGKSKELADAKKICVEHAAKERSEAAE